MSHWYGKPFFSAVLRNQPKAFASKGNAIGVRLLLHDLLDAPCRRKFLFPFSLLVHRRFNLELAVEIVLGRIYGDPPADFAVEVKP